MEKWEKPDQTKIYKLRSISYETKQKLAVYDLEILGSKEALVEAINADPKFCDQFKSSLVEDITSDSITLQPRHQGRPRIPKIKRIEIFQYYRGIKRKPKTDKKIKGDRLTPAQQTQKKFKIAKKTLEGIIKEAAKDPSFSGKPKRESRGDMELRAIDELRNDGVKETFVKVIRNRRDLEKDYRELLIALLSQTKILRSGPRRQAREKQFYPSVFLCYRYVQLRSRMIAKRYVKLKFKVELTSSVTLDIEISIDSKGHTKNLALLILSLQPIEKNGPVYSVKGIKKKILRGLKLRERFNTLRKQHDRKTALEKLADEYELPESFIKLALDRIEWGREEVWKKD